MQAASSYSMGVEPRDRNAAGRSWLAIVHKHPKADNGWYLKITTMFHVTVTVTEIKNLSDEKLTTQTQSQLKT